MSNRREVLKGLVTGGFLATGMGYAANETMRVGCIGTGGRTQALMKALARIPGAQIAAVCDVWDENLAKGRELAAPGAAIGTPSAEIDARIGHLAESQRAALEHARA